MPTILGMPAIDGFASVNWRLLHSVASMKDAFGRNQQREVFDGDVWGCALNAPPGLNEDGEILAAWLDEASRGDRWFYGSPPQNRFGGNWNPAELISNGTFLNGATTGWTAEASGLISVNARSLRLRGNGGIGVADQDVTLEANKPHVLMFDLDVGTVTSATGCVVFVRTAADGAVEQNFYSGTSGRVVLPVIPSQASMEIELRIEQFDVVRECFWSNISLCRCLTVNGGGQSGNSLKVDGGPSSLNQALKAGQFVTLRVKNRWQMLRLTKDFDTDANGAGVLRFEPALRHVPVDGEAVVLRNPFCRMYVPDHLSEDQVSAPNWHGITVSAMEDPTELTDEIQSDLIWAWDAENLTLAPTIGSGTPTLTRNDANGSYFDSAGVLRFAAANVPRFDYNPITLALKGLLIEPARTNLLVRSEELNLTPWAVPTGTLTANAAVAPDGNNTADKLGGVVSAYIIQEFAFANGTTYSISFYVKAVAADVSIAFGTLTTGDVAAHTTTGTATSAWQRKTFTFTADATDMRVYIQSLTGTDGIYIFGAQLEAASTPSSYVKTTTAAVSRAADADTLLLSAMPSWNGSEFSILAEAIHPGGAVYTYAGFDDGTLNERVQARVNGGFGELVVSDGGVVQALISDGAVTANAINRIAIGVAANNFAVSANGAVVVTDTLGTMPTPTTLSLGAIVGFEQLNGHLRRLHIYKRKKPSQFSMGLSA